MVNRKSAAPSHAAAASPDFSREVRPILSRYSMKRIFRVLRIVLGFGLGFGVAAATVAHFVPPLRIPDVQARLEWLGKNPEFDVLVVGSSRMRQLEPEILNEVFLKAGMQIRTFNLGLDGVRPPEDGYLLERALVGRKAPLRLVIVETNRLALRIGDEDFGTARMTYWHDAKRMGTIWDRTWSNENKHPLSARESVIGYWRNLRFLPGHVAHWVTNESRMGLGFELTEKFLWPHQIRKESRRIGGYLGKKLDGFTARPDGGLDAKKNLEYAIALGNIKNLQETRLDPGDPASQAHFAEMEKIVHAHGAKLVVVAPPVASPEIFRPLAPEIIFLDYSDPSQYPELFDPKVRMDNSHLNDAGAKLFSKLVAEQLAAAIVGKAGGGGN
jgi:hypothetical protein